MADRRGLRLAVLCLALLLPPAAAPAATPQDSVLTLINRERARAGCGPVTTNAKLAATAQAHSKDMALRNYFSHTAPGKGTPKARARKQGYASGTIGETIAAGQRTPADAVAEWMGSPGHRKIILNCSMKEAGAGMFHQKDDQPLAGNSFAFRTYWTLVMAHR